MLNPEKCDRCPKCGQEDVDGVRWIDMAGECIANVCPGREDSSADVSEEDLKFAIRCGRLAAAEDIEEMPSTLGNEGWDALANQAEDAGFDRRLVLRRRRRRNDFTTDTIEAAYQYGYRRAAQVARGGDGRG